MIICHQRFAHSTTFLFSSVQFEENHRREKTISHRSCLVAVREALSGTINVNNNSVSKLYYCRGPALLFLFCDCELFGLIINDDTARIIKVDGHQLHYSVVLRRKSVPFSVCFLMDT